MNGYEISTDPARLDIGAMHAYLTRSYWSPGIPLDIVERAARNSLCFGLYERATGAQVGLTRVVTDHATFAYLCDVYVLEEHRGHGLGKWMMREVMAHPALTGARRVMLARAMRTVCSPAFGFSDAARNGVLMEILRPDIYRDTPARLTDQRWHAPYTAAHEFLLAAANSATRALAALARCSPPAAAPPRAKRRSRKSCRSPRRCSRPASRRTRTNYSSSSRSRAAANARPPFRTACSRRCATSR